MYQVVGLDRTTTPKIVKVLCCYLKGKKNATGRASRTIFSTDLRGASSGTSPLSMCVARIIVQCSSVFIQGARQALNS